MFYSLFAYFALIFTSGQEELLKTLPGFCEERVILSPLRGGITNQNYILLLGESSYFLKIDGETKKLLGASSSSEREGLEFELSPKLFIDAPEEKLLVLEFIKSEKVSIHDQKTLVQIMEGMKKLHLSSLSLSRKAAPHEMIEEYLEQLPEREDLRALYHTLPQVMPELFCPCHLDLHCQNILMQEGRLYFIDWEYARESDPLFDIAILASNEQLSTSEMEKVALTYEEGIDLVRLNELRALADFRSALWYLIQEKYSNSNYPFAKWGERYLNKVKERL